MTEARDRIAIIGGGTAGWLTACFLARKFASARPDGVKITLIESPVIPPIGVGEGTLPSLRLTLATIGIDETDFIRATGATFKQGIHFADWSRPGQSYFHPFNSPHPMGGVGLSPYWALGDAPGGLSYADAVTTQADVYRARLAPKRLSDAPYSGPMNYAYHLDVHRLAEFLQTIGKQLGVEHRIDHVDSVDRLETGDIAAVNCRETGRVEADLFIDCTGFAGRLIEKEMGSEFAGISDTLFCDRAVAVPVSYDTPDAPLPSTTISTAQENGWTWDIALQDRRGVGYVYSSAHTDEARAETVLRNYLGDAATQAEPRHLKMRTGYRTRQWSGNCVAVGLSAGFLEPLESTGILLVEAAAHLIGDLFPRQGPLAPVARQFNRAMTERYRCAIDFIKMHFYLSARRDTQFWQDNTRAESVPDSLAEKLELWRYRMPSEYDLTSVHESFRHINYEYVLLGMGHVPALADQGVTHEYRAQAQREFATIRQASQRAVAALPDHRALVSELKTRRFGQARAPEALA